MLVCNGEVSGRHEEVMLNLLQHGMVTVHFFPWMEGVSVPERLVYSLLERFAFSYSFDVPDLSVDGSGISCTLSFHERFYFCVIPWRSVFLISSPELHEVYQWGSADNVGGVGSCGGRVFSDALLRTQHEDVGASRVKSLAYFYDGLEGLMPKIVELASRLEEASDSSFDGAGSGCSGEGVSGFDCDGGNDALSGYSYPEELAEPHYIPDDEAIFIEMLLRNPMYSRRNRDSVTILQGLRSSTGGGLRSFKKHLKLKRGL